MFITTMNEIQSLMPTAKWDRPQQLFGYIEEEEVTALEPLLGDALYRHLLSEYDRLRNEETGLTDITATTVRPTGKAKIDPKLAHSDVTERLEQITQGKYRETYTTPVPGEKDVPEEDMRTIKLLRICQQIEFYRMLSHKAGLLTVSFNEGGGMNMVGADNYDPADEKRLDRVAKDAYMSAGRSTDTLLLFLESDAKSERQFTELWMEADSFYLHKDLLFQTARVLDQYLDINGERQAYVKLVRDIRFCQNTYLKPAVGGKLLKAMVAFANCDPKKIRERVSVEGGDIRIKADSGQTYRSEGQERQYELGEDGKPKIKTVSMAEQKKLGRLKKYEVDKDDNMRISVEPEEHAPYDMDQEVGKDLLDYLRQALAFFVESRRQDLLPTREKLARRDSMSDAKQALAMACKYIEENLDKLGESAVDTPIYNACKERERREEYDRQHAKESAERRRREACHQQHKKLFTAFPHTTRQVDTK